MKHLVSFDSQVQLSSCAPNDQCPPIILMHSLQCPHPPPHISQGLSCHPLGAKQNMIFLLQRKELKHHMISHELFQCY